MSLTRSSASFRPDLMVGPKQRGMMYSPFSAIMTLREKAPSGCMRRLAQA